MSYVAPRLRPLGVGDVLDEAIRLYRNNFGLLAGISAVLLVPLYLIQYLWQTFLFHPGSLSRGDLLATVGVGAGLWGILSFLANAAVNITITYAISEIYLGRRPTIGSAYAGGLRRFGAAVGLSILVAVLLGIMSLTIIGIPVAIYFGICWILSFQALVLEERGITASMGRSRGLVRGHWWRVFAIGFLLVIIVVVFGFAVGLVGGILGAILGIAGSSGFVVAIRTVIEALVAIITQVLPLPLAFCGAVLIYYDLRVRKEGFDLELLAREMGGAPQPPQSGPTTA